MQSCQGHQTYWGTRLSPHPKNKIAKLLKDYQNQHKYKNTKGSGFPSLYGVERTEIQSLEEEEAVDSNYNILPVSESEDDEGSINEVLG